MKWPPLLVGIGLDILDFFIGWIPLLGDVIGIIGIIYFYRKIGPIALSGAIELLPGLALLPTFSAIGLYAAVKS